jgi:proteasome assembly chaperone (PAC2) family protein
MPENLKLIHPGLVAVWPGMGNVALNAGVYLLSKLDMNVIAELEARDLFDVDNVEVKAGIVQPGRRPRNRFFLWRDPLRKHDLVVFVGEAQPPVGKYRFCRQIISYAREIGVERIFILQPWPRACIRSNVRGCLPRRRTRNHCAI